MLTDREKMSALLNKETLRISNGDPVEAKLADNGYIVVKNTETNKCLDPDTVFELAWNIKPKESVVTRETLEDTYWKHVSDDAEFSDIIENVLKDLGL